MAFKCARAMYRNRFVIGIVLLTAFGSSSKMAPIAAGTSRIFEGGTGQLYAYETTVTLNEPAGGSGKDVGYQLLAEVGVSVVWQSPENKYKKLLEFEVAKPRLLIKSRKAPTPEGFVVHKSNLENMQNYRYLVHWADGKVDSLYLDTKEEVPMVNLKRGIASLFQLLDTETKESDVSGDCVVFYRTIDPHSFTKTKTDCEESRDVPRLRHADPILGASLNSSRRSTYVLSKDLSFIESIIAEERHDLRVAIKNDVGGSVSTLQKLTFSGTKANVDVLKSTEMDDALKEYKNTRKITPAKKLLNAEMHPTNCEQEECPPLPKLIRENREHLSAPNLGTLKSAAAFLKVLQAAKRASREELAKSFKGKKNKEILAQLCDLAGAIQSPESHDTIMRILDFDSDQDLDNNERYLWALSTKSQPDEVILKDIYKKSQSAIANEKLSETLLLTLASMTNKYRKMMDTENDTLTREITQNLLKGLDSCKDENCKYKYLRAFKNLKSPESIGALIKYALEGKRKVSVAAMKALRSFDASYWSEEVIDAAQRIYYQAGKRFDSSSRTLAVDILLESNPRREILREMLLSLTHKDPAFEVKQYLVQRVKQLSDKCPRFSQMAESILEECKNLFNNYDIKAQRGLTTAFTRSISSSNYRNASLVSVQELHGGFLKRGLVDVIVETSDKASSLFTLGLFAGGLSSFVSSTEKQEENDLEEEEEPATAGMELTVLGTQLRPFVFFSGQGELMGHVWSGTASERTSAYQALLVTHDQLQHIYLQNGIVSQLQLLGVVSFDLSGQVQMSLWNRNANSLVEKNAGIFLQGTINADTTFVKSKVEFNVASEVRLNLQSNLNFYNEISLCMQLSQPEAVIKHNIHKIERIPGSKHRLRKSKYKQTKVPGRTYALNRKNNEMCNLIFKDK